MLNVNEIAPPWLPLPVIRCSSSRELRRWLSHPKIISRLMVSGTSGLVISRRAELIAVESKMYSMAL